MVKLRINGVIRKVIVGKLYDFKFVAQVALGTTYII